MIALVLIVVVVVLVAALVGRRHALELGAPGPGGGLVTGGGPLASKVAEWQRAQVIDAGAAQRILAFEAEHAAPRSRIPIAAEAIGYVGAALVVAAIALLVGGRWDDQAVAVRIAVFAVPALAAAAGGWTVGRRDDPAFVRLGSALWLLACGAAAGVWTVVWVDVWHAGDPPTRGGLAFVASLASIGAIAAYRARPLPLQLLATYVGSLLTALGLVQWSEVLAADERWSTGVWGGVAALVGAAWLLAGLLERVEPSVLARILGPVTMLVGLQVVRADVVTAGLWLGALLAAGLVALGVTRGDVVVLLLGTAGLFQWAPQLAVHHLADTIGTEATLLVVGLMLIAVAAGFVRLVRRLPRARADVSDIGPNPGP
jgi:hypothetical protein